MPVTVHKIHTKPTFTSLFYSNIKEEEGVEEIDLIVLDEVQVEDVVDNEN